MAIRKRGIADASDSAKKLVREFRKWTKLHDNTLETARIESEQKKLVNKLFISLIKEGKISAGDFIRVANEEYYYDFSFSEKISAEAWYKLFREGDIKKDQFFDAISVAKAKAEKTIGKDQTDKITENKTGDTLDIRKRDASVPGTKTPELIKGKAKSKPVTETKPKTKVKRKRVRLRR